MKNDSIFFVCLLLPFTSDCFAEEEVDTIFLGGTVVTMNDAQPSAEAVAVSGGKIIAVGLKKDILPLKKDKTQIVDLKGKTLLPGFIDPHLHPYLAGLLLPMNFLAPEDWDLPGRTSKAVLDRETYLKRMTELESKMDNKESWLYVWGYHHYFHGEIDRRDLDKISSTRPILLWHRSFHELFLNTAALKELGIEEKDVKGVPHTSWEKGHFYETGGEMVLPLLLPMLLEPNKYRNALKDFQKLVQQGGITTIADLSGYILGETEFQLTKSVLDQPGVPFRTILVADGMGPSKRFAANPATAVEFVKNLQKKNGDKVFFSNHVKLFSDGAFFSQLMQVNEPYTDGHKGEWLMTPLELKTAARAFWHAGFQIHVHTNGDMGVDVVLDILEKLNAEKPNRDHRFTLEHFGLSTPEQCKRIGRLGACVSANTYYLHILGELYSKKGLGPARAHHISRMGSLAKNKVPTTYHSDMVMAPAKPLLLAWCAVNRRGVSGKELGPTEKVSVDDAMKAITINAAFVLRQEKIAGSIEVGKRADFTILGQNPYKVDPMILKDIPVVATVFAGKLFENK